MSTTAEGGNMTKVYKAQKERLKWVCTSSRICAISARINLCKEYPWFDDFMDSVITGKATDEDVREAVLKIRAKPKNLRDFLE